MAKKDDKKKQEAYLQTYREMIRKLTILSRISIRQFLGSRPEGDPRVEYLTNLETFKNLANVHLGVITNLAIKKLGISQEEYLKMHGDVLQASVRDMEQDLAVTSWDKANPIFDLPKYLERTKLWPK